MGAAVARPRGSCAAAPHQTGLNTQEPGGVAHGCSARTLFLNLKFLLITLLLAVVTPAVAAPPGTPITNRGEVTFQRAGGTVTVSSNEVSLLVAPSPSLSALTLMRLDSAAPESPIVGDTVCVGSSGNVLLDRPRTRNGQPIPHADPVQLSSTGLFHGGDTLFISLSDPDRNRDSLQIDQVEITLTTERGDSEVVLLQENAPDSGRFIGHVHTRVAAAVPGDCML